MKRSLLVLAALGCWFAVQATAQNTVGVDGSSVRYATAVERKIGDANVTLKLTGTALRKKLVFNVYTIGSYVDNNATVTAQDLASCNKAKMLHLVMERDVSGSDMADAFVAAIRNNYKEPEFADSLALLTAFFRNHSANKGDQIRFIHIPDKGLECVLDGKGAITLEDRAFSQAVWEIYLGRNNLGEAIKRGLTSRL